MQAHEWWHGLGGCAPLRRPRLPGDRERPPRRAAGCCPPRTARAGRGEGHRRDIEAILESLGIPLDDPVGRLWYNLPASENGLDRVAHRSRLGIRKDLDPIRTLWDQFQAILDLVLNRLEATSLQAFSLIDEILARPSSELLERLESSIPQNTVTLGYFFSEAGPGWVAVLKDSDYLRPDEVPDPDGRLLLWPAGSWLIRMAPIAPEFVAAALEALSDTENPDAARSALGAALLLPPEALAPLSNAAAGWVGLERMAGRSDAGPKIVERLAEAGFVEEALLVARATLAA